MAETTRPTSPSNAGGKPDRQSSVAFNPAAAAALAGAGDDATRPASASTAGDATRPASASTSGAPADASRGSVAGRPASPSNAAAAEKTAEPARASVSGGAPAVQERPASGSVSGGDVKTADARAPTTTKLGAVPEDAVAPRASIAKSSPAPDAAAPAPVVAAAPAPTSSAVTAANGGGTAQTNKALADRADKKDQLAGGDKDITKPRPIEDVKRELEQGTQRCTDAWFGKTDAFQALKPEDGTVRYMGFVNDGGDKSALFFVDGGKTGASAATAKADEKSFRLIKLSALPDTKEEVKLMYTSSPIVLASAAGHGSLVKLLMDRFGLDPTVQQTVYTAVWDDAKKTWFIDNSQGKKVSAGEVAAVNGFEDVAQTGGCRMCAGGDCVIA